METKLFNRDISISLKKKKRTFTKSYKMEYRTKQEAKFNSLVLLKLILKHNI